MALEKKFSDFQRSECIDRDIDTPIDDRFCPTCVPNNSFKMEGHFYDIEKPFLHEGFCEYWTRVYDADVRIRYKMSADEIITREQIIKTGVEKISIHFEKIINNETREYLFRSAFFDKRDSIASSVHSPYVNKSLGYANLVKIPHFNFESVPDIEDASEEEGDEDKDQIEEIVLKQDNLYRRLVQLDGALRIYGYSYSMLQNSFDNTKFVIREKGNPSRFVNYEAARGEVKSFRTNLSSALIENGYGGLGTLNTMREQCKKIKLVFNTSISEYYLESIFVLSEQCPDEYRKLDLKNYPTLHGVALRKAFHFIANLDEVINDITSRETKPWIDFTIDRFYPDMIVDYGNIGSISEEDYAEFGCLLDKAGFGRGQFADYLGKSLVSAFKSAEEKMHEVGCRSKEDLAKKSYTALADGAENLESDSSNTKYYDAYIKFIVDQIDAKYREGFITTPTPVPPPEPPEQPPSYSEELYVVVKGDTMLEIASRLRIGINALLDENTQFDKSLLPAWKRGDSPGPNDRVGRNNRNPNWIYPGESLRYKNYDVPIEEMEEGDPIGDSEPTSTDLTNQPTPEKFETKTNNPLSKFKDYVDFINEVALRIEGSQTEVYFDSSALTDKDSFLLASFAFKPIDGFGLDSAKKLVIIQSEQTLVKYAKAYQSYKDAQKIIPTEDASKKKRNPHMKAISDAWKETIDNENTIIGLIGSDSLGRKDIPSSRWTSLITTIGLCGMSKMSQKLFKCLLGGATIDQFYNAAFIKLFEFMEINTLSLFLNGLPFPIRSALDEAIESEFGSGLRLEDLIGISKERGGTIKDYVSFNVNKELGHLFTSEEDPLSNPQITPRRKKLIINYLGNNSNIYNELVKKVIDINTDAARRKGKKIKKQVRKAKRKYMKGLDSFDDKRTVITKKLDLFGNVGNNRGRGAKKRDEYLKELNSIERTEKSLGDNNIGESVDVIFDIFYDFMIDWIIDEINADELVDYLSSFPAGEVLVGFVADYYESCPKPTVFSPPAKDFMKSFSVDICDPEFNLKLPSISLPSLSLRYNLLKAFSAGFSDLILKLFSDIVVGLLKRTLALLEDLICQSMAAIGGLAAEALSGNITDENSLLDSFQTALDEAFCGGAINSQTGESRAKELADALFRRALPDGEEYDGSAGKTANIISSVASQEEILEAIVDGNEKINSLIASAVGVLAPEMQVLLGTPDQVAFFFQSLGAFLPEDDKQRIRDLLEAGIPNLPLSSAICLTNDQLDQWNDLRNQLLQNQGLTPEQAFEEIEKLNEIVEDALEEAIGDQLELGNPEGPFLGALSDEALKDVCNPKNLFNDNSRPEMDIEEENGMTEDYYNNIHRLLMWGYYGPSGIFGNALRDKEDKREGISRSLIKLFNPNYNNSYTEQISKFNNKGLVGKFAMRALADNDSDGNPSGIGYYPDTVALYMLNQLKDSTKINLPDGVNSTYEEGDFKSRLLFKDFAKKDSLGYECIINERENENLISSLKFSTNKNLTKAEEEFLSSINGDSLSRESIFKSFIKRGLSQELDYAKMYSDVSSDFFEKTFTEVTTDDRISDGIPIGFKFGYVSDTITSRGAYDYLNPDGSTLYDLDESEETLGVFRNERLIPLNPKLYGGTYSSPAFTLEQPKFFGWLEFATKAFESVEGCEPKNEPMFSMSDIKERVKFLENNLKNYAQLETDPECTYEKPFKLLVDKKMRSNIDGVVRTTIRAYLGEYFLMGIGSFGNVELSNENYDNAFTSYVVEKMRSEMYDLGDIGSLRRVSLKQEKYWYTFLEQCVQSYNEMVRLKEIIPSPAANKALMNIRFAQAAYRGVPKNTKFLIKKLIKNGDEPIKKKDMSLDEKLLLLNMPGRMSLLAMDFRARENQDQRDNFFNGEKVKDITMFDAKVVSNKKLKFFTKILTIKMFEDDCEVIMKELLSSEFERFTKTAFTGIRDKPKINDIKKAFFGFKSFFPESTSRIGLGDYYIEKQLSGTDTGTVPDVTPTNDITPSSNLSGPHFIVEKYARLEPKISSDTPSFILNTTDRLRGVCSLADLEQFLTTHSEALKENRISDFYGDLEFEYKSNVQEIFDNGFTDQDSIDLLIELNPDLEKDIRNANIKNSIRSKFDDFSVKHSDKLLPANHSKTPSGTLGSSGIKYGLRICLVLPPGIIQPNLVTSNTAAKSKFEKSYLYADGGFSIPICTEEISVVDTSFYNLNPFIGTEPYDLECLINKMVQNPEFTTFFTTAMPLKVVPSFAAIFYSQNFMGSLGLGANERSEDYMDKLENGVVEASSDDWDGTMNTFVKNFLRREFQSFYLSNSFDGFGREDLSERERRRLFGSFNPFDSFALPAVRIPWFKRRRLKMKIFDANGNECANPKKDFES